LLKLCLSEPEILQYEIMISSIECYICEN
jgi:hypothetical protein